MSFTSSSISERLNFTSATSLLHRLCGTFDTHLERLRVSRSVTLSHQVFCSLNHPTSHPTPRFHYPNLRLWPFVLSPLVSCVMQNVARCFKGQHVHFRQLTTRSVVWNQMITRREVGGEDGNAASTPRHGLCSSPFLVEGAHPAAWANGTTSYTTHHWSQRTNRTSLKLRDVSATGYTPQKMTHITIVDRDTTERRSGRGFKGSGSIFLTKF